MDTPGFVDLQVNGCLGIDFSDLALSEEKIAEAFRHVLASGTAAFLPTIITSPPEVYERNLPLFVSVMAEQAFAGRVLGLHIEGPFISKEPGAVGAHRPECVRAPDPAFLDRLQTWAQGTIKLLTIAAELPGAADLCRHAVDQGIAVSLGHQLASEQDMQALADAGATALTHLGNGIPNLLPRHPNTIWAGLAEERLTAMLITDGHHLPAAVLKAMIRAKGVERVVVVSDASAMAGMPPGEYEAMGNRIKLEPSGKLWNPDKECLVGSSAMMMDCMNVLAGLGFLSLDEMLAVGATNPLRLIGIDPETWASPAELTYEPGQGFSSV